MAIVNPELEISKSTIFENITRLSTATIGEDISSLDDNVLVHSDPPGEGVLRLSSSSNISQTNKTTEVPPLSLQKNLTSFKSAKSVLTTKIDTPNDSMTFKSKTSPGMKNEKSTTPNLGQPAVKPSNKPTNAENVTKSAKHDSNQKRKAIVTKKSNSSAEVNSKYSLVIIAIAFTSVQRLSQVVNWV